MVAFNVLHFQLIDLWMFKPLSGVFLIVRICRAHVAIILPILWEPFCFLTY